MREDERHFHNMIDGCADPKEAAASIISTFSKEENRLYEKRALLVGTERDEVLLDALVSLLDPYDLQYLKDLRDSRVILFSDRSRYGFSKGEVSDPCGRVPPREKLEDGEWEDAIARDAARQKLIVLRLAAISNPEWALPPGISLKFGVVPTPLGEKVISHFEHIGAYDHSIQQDMMEMATAELIKGLSKVVKCAGDILVSLCPDPNDPDGIEKRSPWLETPFKVFGKNPTDEKTLDKAVEEMKVGFDNAYRAYLHFITRRAKFGEGVTDRTNATVPTSNEDEEEDG